MNLKESMLGGGFALLAATASLADPVWSEAAAASPWSDRLDPTPTGLSCLVTTFTIGQTTIGPAMIGAGATNTFTARIGGSRELSATCLEDWILEDDLGFLDIITGDFLSPEPAAPDVIQLLGLDHHGEPFVGGIGGEAILLSQR